MYDFFFKNFKFPNKNLFKLILFMNKKQAFVFLEQLQGKGIKLGLKRIEGFLKSVGNPEKKFKSVHIAGTNGKGSTATLIERILRKAGFKTGLYTSPHLVRFNERFRINGVEISDKVLVKLVVSVKGEMDKSGFELSYFEFVTAMAFEYFADSGVEIAILEVGMGGRLDATNVVKPFVSVITNVAIEHEKFLGTTVAKIAEEKAGVIKEGVPVVTSAQNEVVLHVIRRVCKEKKSHLSIVQRPLLEGVGLKGFFQKWNAALAVAAVKQLKLSGVVVEKQAIKEGLFLAKIVGRFDIVKEKPFVVFDCAHNPACCVVLAKSFTSEFSEKKALLVFGASVGKNVLAMAERLVPISKRVFVTGAKYRAVNAAKLVKVFEVLGVEVELVAGVENAVKKAISCAKGTDVVLVTGSCFVVGEALNFLKK